MKWFKFSFVHTTRGAIVSSALSNQKGSIAYEGEIMTAKNNIWHFAKKSFEEVRNLRPTLRFATGVLCLLLAFSGACYAQGATSSTQTHTPPKSWVDAETGHRILRLSDEPNSTTFDINRSAFTCDGLDMIYTVPRKYTDKGEIHVLNLATLETKLLFRGDIEDVVVGTKTRRVFFTKARDLHIFTADIDTGQITQLAAQRPVIVEITSINADETLLGGTNDDLKAKDVTYFEVMAYKEMAEERKSDPSIKYGEQEPHSRAVKMRLDAKSREDLITINLQTGKVTTVLSGTDWLDNVRFSPTDPTLMLYRHEGPYTDVDRLWTIRTDGTQNQLIHQRSQKEESVGHEFWSQDGKTIWYEWQMPKGENFILTGYDVATGKRRYFRLDKSAAPRYYDAAQDESLFASGANRPKFIYPYEKLKSGQTSEWVEVLYPVLTNSVDTSSAPYVNWQSSNNAVNPNVQINGWFRSERLINLHKEDGRRIQPDVRISPDKKLVIFTSNMFGPSYVFAAEVNK